MASKKHVHKYHRINSNGYMVWACALPNCTHFMPKNVEDMVEGKMSLCWECGEQFVMTPITMKEDKPKCIQCSTANFNELADLLNSKGI